MHKLYVTSHINFLVVCTYAVDKWSQVADLCVVDYILDPVADYIGYNRRVFPW